jgi:hypothetical protein
MKYNLFSLNEDQYPADSLYGPESLRSGHDDGADVTDNVFNILDPYLS